MPRQSALRSALLPALLLIAAACGGGGGAVHLGMAGPFTEGFGEMNKRGAELAAAEINAAGGIDGDSLIIDYKDDKGDGATAVGIAQGYVEDARVIGVVGHVNSGAMVAAAKVYDGNLPAVATTASSAQLTGISPWAFRVISSDSSNGVDLARFAQRLGKKRAAILYENDSYGRGLADAFRGAFTGQVIGLDPIPADGTNSTLYIEWLLAHEPDIVFVAGTERSGMSLLRVARARGLAADFLGGDGWTGVVSAGEAAEGALVGAPFTSLDPRPEAQKFVSAFRQRFSIEPDGNSALAYDAVMLLTAGIRAVGRDRAALRGWLANLQTEGSFAGVTGPIAFHATGDPIGKSFTMTRVVRGNLVLAERGAP